MLLRVMNGKSPRRSPVPARSIVRGNTRQSRVLSRFNRLLCGCAVSQVARGVRPHIAQGQPEDKDGQHEVAEKGVQVDFLPKFRSEPQAECAQGKSGDPWPDQKN